MFKPGNIHRHNEAATVYTCKTTSLKISDFTINFIHLTIDKNINGGCFNNVALFPWFQLRLQKPMYQPAAEAIKFCEGQTWAVKAPLLTGRIASHPWSMCT